MSTRKKGHKSTKRRILLSVLMIYTWISLAIAGSHALMKTPKLKTRKRNTTNKCEKNAVDHRSPNHLLMLARKASSKIAKRANRARNQMKMNKNLLVDANYIRAVLS